MFLGNERKWVVSLKNEMKRPLEGLWRINSLPDKTTKFEAHPT
jgi:hypothetical protein